MDCKRETGNDLSLPNKDKNITGIQIKLTLWATTSEDSSNVRRLFRTGFLETLSFFHKRRELRTD